jgi:hypothetical protein
LALSAGAYIIPSFGADGLGRLDLFGLGGLVTRQADILSLLGFPDFLREARAEATRRPGSQGLSELQDILGQQATLSDLGNGGDLTFGKLPLLALVLVLFSSVLLVGAVLPPGVVSRVRMAPASYARARQPLALAAIGILIPVAIVAILVGLS